MKAIKLTVEGIVGVVIGSCVGGILYGAMYEAMCQISVASCSTAFLAFIIVPSLVGIMGVIALGEGLLGRFVRI